MRSLYFFVLLLFVVSCSEPEKKPEVTRLVRAMKVEEPVSERIHTFPGRTRASDRTNLSFRVSGPLIELPIDVGSQVEKGSLLAQIDPKGFEVNVDRAQGKLERAEANLRFARSDYQRALKVREQDPGAIAESTVDEKEQTVRRMEGEVKSAHAELDGVEDDLSYATLVAPYTGIIVARYVENYEYVNAKVPVLRMLNSEQTEMTVDLPQRIVSDLRRLQSIQVTFEMYPEREFPATIKELAVEASSTTRTYPATLQIENIDASILLAGMAGDAKFTFALEPDSKESGMEVASGAVFTDDQLDKSFVWLVQKPENLLKKQEVKTGRMTKRGILIRQGLQPGDWVVTAGVHSAQEGEQVRLLPVVLDSTGRQLEQWAKE